MVAKNERKTKDVKLSDSERKERQIELLLATMWSFIQQGREEVSLAEFQESIAELQKKEPSIGYLFSDRFLLSPELLNDLRELDYKGYIRDYHCRLDRLLPKRFLSLTNLGRGIGESTYKELKSDIVAALTSTVKTAIDNYHKRWRLWVR